MFGMGKKAQPKDAYEQPEIVEDASEKMLALYERSFTGQRDKRLPISYYTGEPFDPEWGQQMYGNAPNKHIPTETLEAWHKALFSHYLGQYDLETKSPQHDPSIISKVWR